MISFTTIEQKFSLKNKLTVRNWVKSILSSESKKLGEIVFVFCNDEYLAGLNEKFLNHDTLTDIITFDYTERDKISGDICISIERVRENSVNFSTTFDEELGRVMAHGVLHLAGYKDKSAKDKIQMRQKEDLYLSAYPNL
jgi:probable rRNA maturation factor